MSGLNLPAAVARRWHQKPTLNHAECRAVYITDSVLVKIGRHQVAFHRGECEFQFFWKLWIAILLTLSPSTVRTITEVMSKFHMFEILVTRKKLGRNSFNIFQFSWKRCGIFAFRLPVYGDQRFYRSGANSSGISLKLPPAGAKFFYRCLFKGSLIFIADLRGCHLCHSVEGRWLHSCVTFKKVLVNTVR